MVGHVRAGHCARYVGNFQNSAPLPVSAVCRYQFPGWVSNGATTPGFPILDWAARFQVNFTVQVDDESHSNDNRAGFSIILLSDDARGIELAFWENEIWAQNDDTTGGLFKRGEGTIFPSATGLINYQVIVFNNQDANRFTHSFLPFVLLMYQENKT